MKRTLLLAAATLVAANLTAPVAGAAELLWHGSVGSNTWDVTTSADWERAGIPGVAAQFFNADNVTFDDSAANKTVVISNAAPISPGGITVNNTAGNDYTFTGSGSISGTTGITKNGTGKLTLTTNNTCTGTTTITAGVLQIGNGGTTGSLGTGNVINNASLVFNRSDAYTVASNISGTGGARITGGGTATFTGTNSYAGGTTISNGSLLLGSATVLGTGDVTLDGSMLTAGQKSGLYLNAAGFTLANKIYANNTGAGDVVIGSTAAITAYGISAFKEVILNGNLTIDSNAADRTDVLNISGTGNVRVAGTKRTIFGVGATSYTYTGNLTIAAGAQLQLGAASATANAIPDASSLTIETGGRLNLSYSAGAGETINALFGSGTIGNNAGAVGSNILTVGSANGSGDFSGNITGAVSFAKIGTGTQILSGANDYSGTTTITGGVLQIGNGGTTGTLGTGAVVNDASLVFNRSDNFVVANLISGTGDLVKDGAGKLTLTNRNTYTGGTVVNAGILELTNGGSIGTIRGDLTINAGAQLLSSAANTTGYNTGAKVDRIFINGGTLTHTASGDFGWGIEYHLRDGAVMETTNAGGQFSFGSGSGLGGTSVYSHASNATSVIAGRITLRENNPNNQVVFTVEDGAAATDLRVSATILAHTNAPTAGIVKAGAGTMELSGANTYAGTTTITGGTLTLAGTGSIATSSKVDLTTAGAKLDITAGNQNIKSLSGVTGTTVALGDKNLTLTGALAGDRFSGAINGSGITIVNAGRFNFAGSAEGTLQLNNGTTLAGNGSVGTLKFGNSTADKVTFVAGASPFTVGTGGISVFGTVVVDCFDLIPLFETQSTFNLINYSGTLNMSSGAFSVDVGTSPGRRTVSVDTSVVGQINLLVSGTSALDLVWNGTNTGGGNAWDNQASANWKKSDGTGVAEKFYNLDSVTFNDIAANKIVALETGTTLNPEKVVVNNSAGATNDYTFTGGTLNVAKAFEKSGTGVLNLNGVTANIAGGLIFDEGMLRLNAGTAVTNGTAATPKEFAFGGLTNTAGDMAKLATLVVDGGTLANYGNINVGQYGTGTLEIKNGGKVSDVTGYVGRNAGSTGKALVTGAGSLWENSVYLDIGNGGSGEMTISDGGKVTNAGGSIGARNTAVGVLTVTGANSIWQSSDVLNIANDGTGTMTISAGGKVQNTVGYLGIYATGIGTATVTGAGSLWENSGNLYVGTSGTGTLNIDNGGKVSNTQGFVGRNGGGVGTVRVTGSDSIWENKSNLYVGYSGTGTLKIENGGAVSSIYGEIGYQAGSKGGITVSGQNSGWTNSSNLYVGDSGTGTLNIDNGGKVKNSAGYVGYSAGSTGTATVTGANSLWQNTGALYVGNSGNGTLNILAGGKVTNTAGSIGSNAGSTGIVTISGAGSLWQNSGNLYVGDSGTGTLNISNGGNVTSAYGCIGGFSNVTGNGIATVSNADSQWNISGNFVIGGYGTGALKISDGGKVTNFTGCIGFYAGSAGTVTVSGADSRWENSGDLTVGYLGTGALNIADGGFVSATGLVSVNAQSKITASAGNNTLTGATVQLAAGATLAFDLLNAVDAAQVGATTNLILHGVVNTSAGNIAVGAGIIDITSALSAPGTYNLVTADSAAYLSSAGTLNYLGKAINGTRAAQSLKLQVSGNTLQLLVGDLNLANNTALYWNNTAAGSVNWNAVDKNWRTENTAGASTIEYLTGDRVIFGGASNTAGGTVNVAGAAPVTVADMRITSGNWNFTGAGINTKKSGTTLSDATGNLVIDTPGNVIFTGMTNTHEGGILINQGTMTLNGGSNVTTAGTTVGGFSDGGNNTGKLIVDNATLSNSKGITVGFYSAGELEIKNGGKVTNTYADIASPGCTGAVRVSGANSRWEISGELDVGYRGAGTLNITDGGYVSSAAGVIGGYWGAGSAGAGMGIVTVSGENSQWKNSGTLCVGYSGAGTLNISAGGKVTSAGGMIGGISPVIGGVVTVTGENSLWTNTSYVNVGYAGTGTLNIQNGGKVSATSVYINNAASTVNIGAAAGETAVAGGVLDTASVYGVGTLQFNHTATDTAPLYFTRDGTAGGTAAIIRDSVNVVQTNGITVFTGDNTYTGTTTINGGVLQVGNGGTAGTLGTGAVINNASLVFNRSNAYTVSNAITGTGTVTVAAGKLVMAGNTIANDMSLLAGTALGGSGTIAGNLAMNNATIDAGATPLVVAQMLTATGANTVTLSDAFVQANSTAGIYDVMTFAGKTGSGTFALGNITGTSAGDTRLTYALAAPTNNALQVQVSGSAASLTWAGTGASNTWTLKNNVTNWTGHATDNQFYVGDSVTFGDSAANKNVNITGNVSPGNVSFTNTAGNDYTLAGTGLLKMSAGTTLSKTGDGIVTVSTAGQILGDISVSGGTLQLGSQNKQVGVKGDQFTMTAGQKITIDAGGRVKAYGATWGNSTEFNTPLFSSPGIQIEVNNGGTLETSVHGLAGMVYTNLPDIVLNGGGTWQMNDVQYIRNVTLNGARIIDGGAGRGLLQTADSTTKITVGGSAASKIETMVTFGSASVWNVADATGDAGADLIVSGAVSGGAAFTKTGAGTMLLAGDMLSTGSMTGAMNVNAGTLLINGNLAGATGAITVASGATLGGTGKIGGKVIVQSGGILSPGNSPGTFTVNNDVTLQAGAIFLVEIESVSNYDKLVLAAGKTLTLETGAQLQVALTGVVAENDRFVIATGYSTLLGAGVFGDSVTANGQLFSVDYSGNQITLTAIPEPSTYGLIAGGVLLVLAAAARRRRNR